MSASTHPWEQQEGEGSRAFAAFTVYLEMGGDRSLRAVGQKCTKSIPLIKRWSAAHRWVDRAAAYDAELQRQAYAAANKKVKLMLDRHIRISLELQAIALEALAIIDPKDIDPKTLLSMLMTSTKMEREAREELVRLTAPKEDDRAGGSLADEIAAAWERRRDGEA